VLVRGLAANAVSDDEALSRFWISRPDTNGQMIARVGGIDDAVTILPEGGTSGGSNELREGVVAFRADVEATEKAVAKDGAHNVNDNVLFCYGGQATFTTWFFGNTTIAISNPSTTTSIQFSMQAGAGATEYNWVGPRATRTPFPRIFGSFPVTVKYTGYAGGSPPCIRVETW
jgi:hypothetical protein